MRRIVCLLAAALLLSLAACGRTEAPAPAPDPAEPEELAAALVNAYADGEDTQALLARLEVKDPAQAALWGGILDYWRYVDSEMPINVQTLPDALPEDDSLCIVVLGFQLNPDGSLQPELVGRLETAMVCARRYPEASVLCTGGPTAWNAPELSEAGQMGAWLVEHGLAPGGCSPSRIPARRPRTRSFPARCCSGNARRCARCCSSAAIITSPGARCCSRPRSASPARRCA